MRNASSTLKISTMTLSVVLAIVHSLLISASTQTESNGPANSILISSGKNYTVPVVPKVHATLGIHLHAVTQGGTVKGQWQIIGSEFGDIKDTITG